MRKYIEAYLDVAGSGYLKSETIKKYIDQQISIDKILPNSASFFYVVEAPSLKYHFMGRQQVSVSGYSNEEFLEKGVALFIQCLHQDDIDIVLNQIFKDGLSVIMGVDAADRKNILTQYNYRFKRKDGRFVNLLEQLYVLEMDEAGRGILFLGNVVVLDNDEILPIRLSSKLYKENQVIETIFSKTYNRVGSSFPDVTNREMDILRNLATGKSSKEIGKKLFISPHTVDTHRRNLLKKLQCNSVVELARLAFKNGLL